MAQIEELRRTKKLHFRPFFRWLNSYKPVPAKAGIRANPPLIRTVLSQLLKNAAGGSH